MPDAPVLLAGRYRLGESLGRGGMGQVFLARDETLERDVAIKEIDQPFGTDGSAAARRTLREARAAARINHPNVVQVYDVLQLDDRTWIVMEYVACRSLREEVTEQGPLDPYRVARIGLDLLGALRTAHRLGVEHRDVKPANVLLADDGRVLLTDFGIAAVDDDAVISRSDVLVGSPQYMAPERARSGHSGPSADLWSLGATLYSAIEGRAPYQRGSTMATLTALTTEEPDPPKNAGVLRPLLDGLLRKDPATRMNAEDAESLARAILTGLSASTEPAVAPKSGPGGLAGFAAAFRIPRPRSLGQQDPKTDSGGAGRPSVGSGRGSRPSAGSGGAGQSRVGSGDVGRASVPENDGAANGVAESGRDGAADSGPAGTASGEGGRGPGSVALGAAGTAEDSPTGGAGAGASEESREAGAAPSAGRTEVADQAADAVKAVGSVEGDVQAGAVSTDDGPHGEAEAGPAAGQAEATPAGQAEAATAGAANVAGVANAAGAAGTANPAGVGDTAGDANVAGDANPASAAGAANPANPAGAAGDANAAGAADVATAAGGGTATTAAGGGTATTAAGGATATGAAAVDAAPKGAAAVGAQGGVVGDDEGADAGVQATRLDLRARAVGGSGASGLGAGANGSGVPDDEVTGSGRPRRGLVVAGALVAVVLAAGAAWAVSSDSDEPRAQPGPSAVAPGGPSAASEGPAPAGTPDAAQGPAAGPGSSAGASGGASPSASASASASAGGRPPLPSGWKLYKDKTGFSVYVPKGWKQSRDRTMVYFRGANKVLGIDQTDRPKSDPVKDWTAQAEYRVGEGDFPNYKKVKIEAVDYFRKAADWEFTFTRSGVPRHANNRGAVVADDKAYGFFWETNADVWDDSLDDLKLVYASFQPAK